METLANLSILYGLEVAALVVLLISAVFARWLAAVVLGGLLATGLMVAQIALWVLMAGVGSATSGSQHGYSISLGFAVVSVIALALYFPLAIARHKKLRRVHAEIS